MVNFFVNRIQQIQLLGRDLHGAGHEKMWAQLEAEIHLHRHKTVIRACRNRKKHKSMKQTKPNVGIRTVVIDKQEEEGLGLSITVSNFSENVCLQTKIAFFFQN